MTIYVITTWVPFNKLEDVDKLTPKSPFNIPNIKRWIPLSTPDGKDGMKTYHIIYIDEGKAEETLPYIMKMLSFFNEIEGYSYKIESTFSGRDMRKMTELKI
jgi:hypothetical protein